MLDFLCFVYYCEGLGTKADTEGRPGLSVPKMTEPIDARIRTKYRGLVGIITQELLCYNISTISAVTVVYPKKSFLGVLPPPTVIIACEKIFEQLAKCTWLKFPSSQHLQRQIPENGVPNYLLWNFVVGEQNSTFSDAVCTIIKLVTQLIKIIHKMLSHTTRGQLHIPVQSFCVLM